MGKWKGTIVYSLSAFFSAGLLVGCNQTAAVSNNLTDNQSVTLQVAAVDNDQTFKDLQDVVKKKFPNVTLVQLKPSDPNLNHEAKSLAADGQKPDIFVVQRNIWGDYKQVGYAYDMTPLINKYKVDLNQFDPSGLSSNTMYMPPGQMWDLPSGRNHHILAFNKDLFDKFGVTYPRNGMTWPQIIDLAQKLTRNEGGVLYHGLWLSDYNAIADEYPLLGLDPKTDQSIVMTDPRWANVFNIYKQICSIPGNFNPATDTDVFKGFASDQNVAMITDWAAWYHLFGGQTLGNMKDSNFHLNWEMVSIPTLPELPDQEPALQSSGWAVTAVSDHKDVAFQVIKYLTTDPTVLNYYAANWNPEPSLPTYKDPDILKTFAANAPEFSNKNINAMFYGKFAVWPKQVSQYEGGTRGTIIAELRQVANKDVNTLLREADDQLNKAVQTAKQQQ